MIPLEWILSGDAVIPPMLIFAQIPGTGWIVVPLGWWPGEDADAWTCFHAAEAYRNTVKEERGY